MSVIEKFELFSNENFNKCYIKDTYPISQTKLNEWVNIMINQSEKYNKEYLKFFALSFAKNFTHISFDTFYEQVRKMCFDIVIQVEMYKKIDKNINIILVITGNLTKSNTWVSILGFKILKNIVTHIVSSSTEAQIIFESTNIRTICLHIDDASYSGEQIMRSVNYITTDSKKFIYYILCPYISTKAYNILTSNKRVKILDKSSNIFPVFRTNIENDCKYCLIEMKKDKKFKNIFQYYDTHYTEDLCTIYFDHKIADGFSVFQKIYTFGTTYESDKNIFGLIHGCEKYYKNLDLTSLNNIYDIQTVIKDVCPKAFYKNINYTYKNEEIPSDIEIVKYLENI